jgi:hypothetical protein
MPHSISTLLNRNLLDVFGENNPARRRAAIFQYQPAEPEELGNGGRVESVAGRAGEGPAYAGTDFIIARDAGLPPSISFSTSYPELGSCRARQVTSPNTFEPLDRSPSQNGKSYDAEAFIRRPKCFTLQNITPKFFQLAFQTVFQ